MDNWIVFLISIVIAAATIIFLLQPNADDNQIVFLISLLLAVGSVMASIISGLLLIVVPLFAWLTVALQQPSIIEWGALAFASVFTIVAIGAYFTRSWED